MTCGMPMQLDSMTAHSLRLTHNYVLAEFVALAQARPCQEKLRWALSRNWQRMLM